LSMKEVSQPPARNTGWATTFSRNVMLVLTPRMRNSRSAWSMTRAASLRVRPQALSLTSSES